MDFSIFDAFPYGIVYDVWEIGTCQHGTVVGNEFKPINGLDVVIDDGFGSSISTTPETLKSDILIYAMPCQMPSLDTNGLVANYMLHNILDDTYFEIVDAGIGKNQHTGRLEHVELRLVQTEVTNV